MKILCVEDNAKLADHISQALTKAGHSLQVVSDGEKAAKVASAQDFDSVILDVGLPGCDGFEVLRQLRMAGRKSWVIMLTARSDLKDRVSGLNAGADDYMTKPFSLEELVARLEAVNRRRETAEPPSDQIRVADVTMDYRKHKVYRAGVEIHFSPREFSLLQIFMQEPGRFFSRDEISERIWQRESSYDSRAVEIYIGRLRKKLDDGQASPFIVTLRGEGYGIRSS